MSKFLPTTGFKWIDSKEFDLNIAAIFENNVFLKLILNILKLRELHSDYPLATDK